MFRSIQFHAIALALLLLLADPARAAQTLRVYTWSDYVDPELVSEFEAQFDAHVMFAYFASDGLRDKELTNSKGTGYDVIMVNQVQMAAYIKLGWLSPMKRNALPNLANIDPRWTEPYADVDELYGAPYFWGTLGIAWRSDLYPAGVHSWSELLEPDESLKGYILMPDFGRELVGIALLAQGYSVNTSDRELIRKSGEMLLRQQPYVQGYGIPSLDENSSLLTGDIRVAPMYSGDALTLQEFSSDIEFQLPEEGSFQWIDYLTIAKDSDQKQLAGQFIDFLNRPEVAARNAEYVYYSTPNMAALEYVSDNYLSNTVIFPGQEKMDMLEFVQPLPARSTKSVNSVMSELRAQ